MSGQSNEPAISDANTTDDYTLDDVLAEIDYDELAELGRLAVQSHVLFAACLAWVETTEPPPCHHVERRENAPLWRQSCTAKRQLIVALNDACGFIDPKLDPLTAHGKVISRRRREHGRKRNERSSSA